MAQAHFSAELLEEMNLLCLYNLDTTQEGLKVHAGSAEASAVAAARRLHEKGLVTQADGGYLTPLGREAALHAQELAGLLDPAELTT
ncbi:MAG: TIGR02647 family protein [Halomonas sp.]|uniref:TIGR02647 family protein n=2 Tax=Halomonadaceae TaxID=28256 RepID=A0ABS6ZHW4_9GAMM|nr:MULTISPECIES: TIGR02647 family protein [Halomonas]MBW6389647.1 TIGR02647 family protein [Halomonas antri]MDX5377435.1 TIGR02647 family protein [Halomonas sp.]MDX5502865.1 TIGR02647 family protein [Halomonas sp.]QTP59968.1 TIGR02647 family protein [Halomonas sulfidivorans]